MKSNSRVMQAAILRTHGADFEISAMDKPSPAAGQVLVRVKASGTNPLDVKIRNNQAPHAKVNLPAVLGIDVAGIIEAVGPGDTSFKPGDEVFGMTGGVGAVAGSLAEYAVVDADLLALKPSNISMKEAAAIPLIFITAWEGLVDRAKIQAGQKVLVQGGAGGVGHMAVQIAKAFGAQVFATVSDGQAAVVESFGAVPVNYQHTSVEQYVEVLTAGEGFDIVYDTVGGTVLDDSFHAVKKYSGHVVSCLGWGSHKLAPLSFRAGTYSGVFTLLPLLTGQGKAHHGHIMKQAARLIREGKLKVIVDPRTFTMSHVGEAHNLLQSKKHTGKIVITID